MKANIISESYQHFSLHECLLKPGAQMISAPTMMSPGLKGAEHNQLIIEGSNILNHSCDAF